MLIQPVEIITLHQLVGELRKTHTGRTFQPFSDTVFGHHVIDGDVLAGIPYEIQKMDFPEPVVIVYHYRSIWQTGIKIQVFFQLGADAPEVMTERVFVQQISFFTFSARIAHHTGGTSDQGYGTVSC